MESDYECPRCHNIFPSQNRIMHDARCTEEKPMALDKSRILQINNEKDSNKNTNNQKEEIKNRQENRQENPPKQHHQNSQPNPPKQEIKKQLSESGEFPEIFVCEICGETLALSDKKDHMFCHNIEKEEKAKLNRFQPSERDIEQQRQIERQIERENEMRRQMQNQQQNQRRYQQQQNQRRDQQQNQRRDQQQNPRRNQQQRMNNQQNNPNNLYDNEPNMLSESDIQFFNSFGMPGNLNAMPSQNPNSNVQIRTLITGPNGETIVRQYNSGGNRHMNNIDMNMNNMMMNPFRMMFGNSVNNTNRIHLPFDFFNNPEISAIFEQMRQNMRNRGSPTDQAILNELPETQIDDVTKLDPEKKNCVICLEDFKNGDKATVLPCIHLFHSTCIQNWLKTNNCCPICKFRLTGENLNSQPQI